jgi:hypothetical protein
MWPWKQRQQREPARPEGVPYCDGDVYPFPGQTERLADLVERDYPPGIPIERGYEELSPGEYHWRGYDR